MGHIARKAPGLPGKARGREMASVGACCPRAGWGSEPAVDPESLCWPQPGWQRLVLATPVPWKAQQLLPVDLGPLTARPRPPGAV